VPIPRLAVQVIGQEAVQAKESDTLPPPVAQGEGEGVGLTPLARGVTGVHL
jgi:hypothetical protein